MHLPIITYSAKISNEETYNDRFEIYGGTYTSENPINIDVRIWNNKYGLADVDNLENFSINFYFGDFEDSSLLKYLTIVQDTNKELNLEINGNIATATFFDDIILSGKANNGNDSDTDNYIDLKIIFNIPDKSVQLKSQDIKCLFIEIVTI